MLLNIATSNSYCLLDHGLENFTQLWEIFGEEFITFIQCRNCGHVLMIYFIPWSLMQTQYVYDSWSSGASNPTILCSSKWWNNDSNLNAGKQTQQSWWRLHYSARSIGHKENCQKCNWWNNWHPGCAGKDMYFYVHYWNDIMNCVYYYLQADKLISN